MKVNYKKVAIWTLVIAATGVAIFQVRKAIINRREEKDSADAEVLENNSSSVIVPPTPEVKFDGEKVLKPNQSSSPELVASKKAFNKIINMARSLAKIPNQPFDPPGFVNADEKRRAAIAGIELLDVNTKYGEGTKKAASIILGATDFTYNRAKAQAIAYAKKFNLPKPY